MIRLAALQMQSVCGDIAANLKRVRSAAFQAAADGATVLVTPELGLTGYGAGDVLRELAEPADGAMVTALQAISVECGVAIVAGFPERAGEAIYNSVTHVNGGGMPAIYRKSHLYGDYERQLFHTGRPQTVLFDHHGVTCGLLICYDVEFPENVRRLALAGADAILVPTALPAGWSGTFIADCMIQTRAFENQVFVAYVNHCGSDTRFSFAGLSRIAAPDGSLLAGGGPNGEAMMTATIDPDAFAISRAENTYLADLARNPA